MRKHWYKHIIISHVQYVNSTKLHLDLHRDTQSAQKQNNSRQRIRIPLTECTFNLTIPIFSNENNIWVNPLYDVVNSLWWLLARFARLKNLCHMYQIFEMVVTMTSINMYVLTTSATYMSCYTCISYTLLTISYQFNMLTKFKHLNFKQYRTTFVSLMYYILVSIAFSHSITHCLYIQTCAMFRHKIRYV